MKLTAILLIGVCMQVSAFSYSQTVSLNGKNMPLSAIFASIEKQTGLSFFFNYALIKNTKPVTLAIEDLPVDDALHEILNGQELDFYQTGKTIFIVKKSSVEQPSVVNDGHLIDVKGRVTNEQGEPLSGASILVKNGKRATLTNEKGLFEFKNLPSEAVLEITFTGYRRKEIPVNGGSMVSVELVLANNQLDQAQVIAYGTTTQRLSTGDVTIIKGEDIQKQPVSNVLSAIEGRVPGLFIVQNSGMPGSSFSVLIRGRNSILSGTDPLYVIDGVPYISSFMLPDLAPNAGGNPLNFINPADIDNISVLKDADATAIYGSRAANGAILITTKKGKAGKTKLDINVNEGGAKAPLKLHWLNTAQYLEMRREAFKNDNVIPNVYNAPDLLTYDSTRYTDWQKLLIGGTAHYHDIQANLSGGNSNTQFIVGAGYHNESTVFPVDGADQKVSAHFNLTNASADQRLKLNALVSYMADFNNLPQLDMTSYIKLSPNAPTPFNDDGSLNWANQTWPSGNPFAVLKRKYQGRTNNLVSSATLSYSLLKGFNLKSIFGYTNMQTNAYSTSPIASQDPIFQPTGAIQYVDNNLRGWSIEPQVNYQRKFGLNQIEALFGSSVQRNTSEGFVLNGYGYSSDAMLENIQAAPTLRVNSAFSEVYKYFALFGRLNYNFDSRYILALNWRRDGSSRFGPNNQFHNFASVGAGWIFTKEKSFMDKFPLLSFGKLWMSYGSTGNDQIGSYQFYELFGTTNYPYQGTTALYPIGFSNPNLQWEETKKMEVGLNLGFLQDRILVNVGYYRNHSNNQLLATPLPILTGFSSVTSNFPATVLNYGWEFSFTANLIKSKKFSWTSSINLTIPYNSLAAFPGLEESTYKDALVIGKPITATKMYHLTGVDPATGIYKFQSKKDPFNPSYPDDVVTMKDFAPKWYGGFQNSFSFKGWQLDVFFQFRKKFGGNYLLQLPSSPGHLSNYPAAVLDRWKAPGDQASQEMFSRNFSSSTATAYQYAKGSDYNYSDVSFLRLSNVSLSYQLPDPLLKKIHVENCRVFFHAQNLLTITPYKGMDPENQSITALPPLRVLTGGVNFSF